jgi:hypothetical protein
MTLKFLHWLGIIACVSLVISCWLPWAYYADAHILNEADRTFTGFYSYKNNYGKPGKMLVLTATFSFILILFPKVGYAVKTYILFISCYNAYCPEKKIGIYLMLFASVAMLICSAFPSLALKPVKTTEKD